MNFDIHVHILYLLTGVDLGICYIPRWFTCPQTVACPLDSDQTGSRTHDLVIASPTS